MPDELPEGTVMNAADMMTSPVVTIGPEATVRDAAWTLLTHRISAVPVLDGQGRLVGILSEGDLLRRAETGTQRRRSWWGMFGVGSDELAAEFVKSHGRKVADVMSRNVITAGEDTPAPEIARLMETHGIKRVPIVADGKLVGIVSRADFLTALTGMHQAAPVEDGDDAALRAAIVARLGRMPWIQPSIVNVAVRGGIVELTGLADSEAQRRAVRIVVETTPGVRTVQDNMRVQPYAVGL
jgi:CBS domain-containing protein